MVNYKIHENGWTVVIDDFDLKTATQEDINQISKLIASNTCILIRNQSLEIEDELRVLSMFKDPEPMLPPDHPAFEGLAADLEKDPTGIIIRITGELRNGLEGGAGFNEALDWHCNMAEVPTRRPIVWLYGKRGTVGSRTTWNNTILAYADLDENTKHKIENLHSIYGNIDASEAVGHTGIEYNTEWTPSLVHKNIAGKIGMFFSPLQIQKFVELSKEESDKLKTILFEHVIKEKYLYHHDWKDGDIVISEQWLGIHKRWPFDRMNKRLVHRAAVDFPDQDYTS